MASTYLVKQAAEMVAQTMGRGASDILPILSADLALNEIWTAYPWRQSLNGFNPFWLVPGKADYGAPLAIIPSDYHSLYTARLIYAPGLGNGATSRELVVRSHLESRQSGDFQKYPADAISYEADEAVFRLSDTAPANISSPQHFVTGSYKKRPTKITNANYTQTIIPWDDIYFSVFVETVRWKMMALTGSERAGQVQRLPDRSYQAQGQAAIAMAAISEMADREELAGGVSGLSPESNLTDW